MLQYIINTSIIWLACLVLYELFLRKESFHQYNRVYLLASLAIGLLLPMAKLENLIPATNEVLRQPTEQVYKMKKKVFISEAPVTSTTAPTLSPAQPTSATSPVSPEQLLWTMYLLGVAMGLTLIACEAFQLFLLYSRGSKRPERSCIIVETGKDHCPFSFFNVIFIRSQHDYSTTQWTVLIAHEKEHSRQLHSLDNMLLIILRVVFWFHPLPHIYYKRLMMVHEFQADAIAATSPIDYGTFLLEQSMLQGAPALTHPFNYSPIKNRIAMLTGSKSSRARLLKYTTIVPLSFLLIIFCTQTSFSGGNNTTPGKVYFQGNEIVFGTYKVIPFEYVEIMQKQKSAFLYTSPPDSVPLKDWRTGYTVMRAVPIDTTPVVINGKPIFGEEAKYEMSRAKDIYLPPVFKGRETGPVPYLFAKLINDFNRLDDGHYYLDLKRLVVDENGDLAYYESSGIVPDQGSGGRAFSFVSDDLKKTINHKIFDLLNGSVKFRPALDLNGKPINVRLETRLYDIEVKDHKARLFERTGGC